MKDVFLVHILLPEVFTSDFYALIPQQRKLINDLLEKRVVLSYSLDMERKNIWVFFETSDKDELKTVLDLFPIIKDVKVSIHELAFHDAAPLPMLDPIMN